MVPPSVSGKITKCSIQLKYHFLWKWQKLSFLFKNNVVDELFSFHQSLMIFSLRGNTCFCWVWLITFCTFYLGLDHTANINKMRILTTISLSINEKDISFQQLRNVLGFEDEDIEEYVIECKILYMYLNNEKHFLKKHDGWIFALFKIFWLFWY